MNSDKLETQYSRRISIGRKSASRQVRCGSHRGRPTCRWALESLESPDDVIRGRTADTLEKIGRTRPDLLRAHLPLMFTRATEDSVAMVRWHLTMLLGRMTVYDEEIGEIARMLLHMLPDESVFVRSWVIVSLCIVARVDTNHRDTILKRVRPMQADPSVAIRSKVRKALQILTDDHQPFPKGWIKSDHLADI
jgi:hypothetical protein